MARRYYTNFAPTQNISPGINSSALTVNCPSFAGWPTSFPFTATFDYGTSSAEIVLVTNISGTVATITRGYNGTVAVDHVGGATFDLTPTAMDLDEANAHINNHAGVHGISGNVVGDSDVQTLANKTFTGATSMGSINATSLTATGAVQGGSLSAGSGAVSGGSGTFSGALQAASSTITGNEVVQGNETVNGSLTVAGNQTNSGSLSASTVTATGAVTGVIAPKVYTNEAAATAAAANVTGNIVYLTSPTTNGYVAGPFEYNGTSWIPLLDDTGWQAPTLGNSWVGYHATDSQFSDPEYRRKNGRVTIDGGCKSGTTGAAIFTLPAGFRPAHTQTFIVYAFNGLARIDVLSTGVVEVQTYLAGGSNSVVLLTGISFIAEQ